MNRFLASLLTASLALTLACGGGGGSSSSGPAPTPIDSDPNATPPVDAAYFKIPSNPLGAIVNGMKVSFNYWNPNASTVSLYLYTNWNDSLSSPAATQAMTRGTGGIWTTGELALPAQAFYAYKVGNEVVLDPYAKSMAQWVHANGATISGDSRGKGAIVDSAAVLPDGGWTPYSGASYYFDGSAMKGTDGATASPYAFGSNRDAIIYEAGVRDLTVDPNLSGFAPGHTWGTYKGLIDMLPHIQKLGVTHVQLLCPLENYTYDQTKIGSREMDLSKTSGANYNWGYDPQNYFTPTGMYSSNPMSPAARINELKTLVNEIHKQGMGVILDVVYNHTANNNVLGDAGIQGYYYRSTSRNGAGSQDVKSEAKMVRKLIVDSIVHWVGEYKVDGFRFDLMGVLDTQTIKAAYGAARALNPKVVFIGEGWNGYYSGPGSDYNGDATAGADQGNSAQFAGTNVAMFSDSYRQIFKNGYPSDGSPAFLSGSAQNPANLFSNIAGLPTNAAPGFSPGSTDNVVSYLTCHDNLCLYDVLAMATKAPKTAAGDAAVLQRAKVGYAVLLTSQGLAFIHAGDEMFRTKETTGPWSNTKTDGTRFYVDNSYNASDAINLVAWSQVYQNGNPLAGGFANYATSSNGYKLYAYVQGLIALRKGTNAFRLPDASRASGLSALAPTSAGSTTLAFGYKAVGSDAAYYVLHNADSVPRSFVLEAGFAGAALITDGAQAGLTPIASPTGVSTAGTTVTLDPLTSAIFRK
ncbi:MAG TPA: alpha-amylase family glycosyl hydrolase [Geothrix sp.]|nr:alpha-amylase family glycosyl hydrolase [Geothrix sp.]